MRNDDYSHPVLPARLTPAEQEFFLELRRVVETSGMSLRRLADMTRLPGSGESSTRAKYTATQWQNWLHGQSLPPRMAVRMLAEALATTGLDARNLVELWALAFMPTPYPQEAGDTVPRPRHPAKDEPGAPPDVPAGHRAEPDSGAPAFSAAYSQLRHPAARMFRLLSLHPGPDLSPAAAASLAGISLAEARGALDELARAGLVEEHLTGRFALDDARRGYAAAQARASEPATDRDTALARLLDHYLQTLTAAVPLGYPGPAMPVAVQPPGPGVLAEALESDDRARAWCHSRLSVIKSLLVQAGERDLNVYCWQVPSVMATFLVRSGLVHDFQAVQRIALAAAGKLADPRALGHAHFQYAHACALLGEVADSDGHLQDALHNFERAGDQAAAAATLNGMAQLFMQQGEYPRALDREEEALRLRLAVGDREAVAHSEETIASIYSRLGDYDLALRHCYRSLDISRETGARLLAADALSTLGFVCLARGDSKRAIATYMEVLAIYRQSGSEVLVVTALTGLGDAQQVAGDEDAARATWQQALALLKDLPNADDQPVRARLARRPSHTLEPAPPVAAPPVAAPPVASVAAPRPRARRPLPARRRAGRPRSPTAPAHRAPR
ncbi:MAG TPA: tetratricopeptide repeat protein [Trebonia sp.]|nr:tetratricopeptide repeat protein [Trebonia sp.]